MNRRLKIKGLFQNFTALISLLTLIFIILSPFYNTIENHLTVLFAPLLLFLLILLVLELSDGNYKKATRTVLFLVALLSLIYASQQHFSSDYIYLFCYYILLLGGIIATRFIHSPNELQTNIFSDLRSLPTLFITFWAPLYLAFGIHVYLSVTKSDIVLSLRSGYNYNSHVKSISSKEAANLFNEAQTLMYTNPTEYLQKIHQAQEIVPTNLFLNYILCSTYQSNGNIEMAKNYITHCIKIDSLASFYHAVKADIHFSFGEIENGKMELNKAYQLNKKCPLTLFLKAKTSMLIDQQKPEIAYAFMDSAYYYCNDINLKYQLKEYKRTQCGLHYYINKIKPYEMHELAQNLHFYSPPDFTISHFTNQNKPDVNNKPDRLKMGTRNFIRMFHDSFKNEDVDFVYFWEDGQRHLIVLLPNHTWISRKSMERLFRNKYFSPKVRVSIIDESPFKYL